MRWLCGCPYTLCDKGGACIFFTPTFPLSVLLNHGVKPEYAKVVGRLQVVVDNVSKAAMYRADALMSSAVDMRDISDLSVSQYFGLPNDYAVNQLLLQITVIADCVANGSWLFDAATRLTYVWRLQQVRSVFTLLDDSYGTQWGSSTVFSTEQDAQCAKAMCLLVVNASCIGPLQTPDALYCNTQVVELLQTWKDKSWRAVVEQYDLQELRNATLTVGDSGSEVQFIELPTASLHQELCRLRSSL